MVCDRVIKDHTIKKLSREKGPKWLQMPCSHMGDGGGGYDCLCSSNPNLRSLGLLALSLLPYSTLNNCIKSTAHESFNYSTAVVSQPTTLTPSLSVLHCIMLYWRVMTPLY